MNLAGLSLDQSPPISVPFRFFLTAPLFAVAAGLLPAVAGAAPLFSRWTPEAIALTHLLTLGFLAMVMCGAAMQLLPVVAGAGVPRPLLAAGWVHSLLTVGTPLLAGGLLAGSGAAVGSGAVLLGAALLGFVAAAAMALWRARAALHTVRTLRLAVAALAVTVLLGLLLAAGHAGWLPLRRDLTGLHLAWGLAGWVGLLIAGTAYQVVPLFQITGDYPPRLARRLGWGAILSLALLAWTPLAALLPAALLLLFAAVTLRLQRGRKRRIDDAHVRFWRWGMVLAAATALWWAAGTLWPPLSAWPSYGPLLGVAAIGGAAMTVMSGMLYKIVPFLVWLHLNNALFRHGAAGIKVPNMKQVISEAAALRQFRLHLGAVALLAAAAVWPQWLARPAGVALALAGGMLWWDLLGAVRCYRQTLATIREASAA